MHILRFLLYYFVVFVLAAGVDAVLCDQAQVLDQVGPGLAGLHPSLPGPRDPAQAMDSVQEPRPSDERDGDIIGHLTVASACTNLVCN